MKVRKHSNDAENTKAIEAMGWIVESDAGLWFRASCAGFHTPWRDSLTAVTEDVRLLKSK